MLKICKYKILCLILSFFMFGMQAKNTTVQNSKNTSSNIFYFGLQSVFDFFKIKQENNATSDYPDLNNNKNFKKNGVFSGLCLGAITKMNNFGLGIEAYYNFGKTIHKINWDFSYVGYLNATQRIYKISNPFGMKIKFGYFLDNSFISNGFVYIFTGMQRFKLNIEHKMVQEGGTDSLFYYRNKKNLTNFFFGLGAMKMLKEGYALGLEYKTSLNSKSKKLSLFVGEQNNVWLNTKFKIKEQSLSLKVLKTF